jgi:hypothetical protein
LECHTRIGHELAHDGLLLLGIAPVEIEAALEAGRLASAESLGLQRLLPRPALARAGLVDEMQNPIRDPVIETRL